MAGFGATTTKQPHTLTPTPTHTKRSTRILTWLTWHEYGEILPNGDAGRCFSNSCGSKGYFYWRDCSENWSEIHDLYASCLATLINQKLIPLFEKITEGLKLVLGENPSVGFICGVKTAIVEHGMSRPGTCCLDAPYELGFTDWGLEVRVKRALPGCINTVFLSYCGSLSFQYECWAG